MTGHRLRLATLFALLALCLPPAGTAMAAEDGQVIILPGTYTEDFAKAPAEARYLFNALAGAMRGETRIDAFGPVTFEYPVIQNLRTQDPFGYEGMEVTSIQVAYAGFDDSTKSKSLIGTFYWYDPDRMRSAATSFSVVYRPIGGVLFIHDVRVERLPPRTQRIALFVVPADRIEDRLKAVSGSFLTLLAEASGNAIRPDDVRPGGEARYFVFAFSLNRLGRGDRLDLLLDMTEAGGVATAGASANAIRPEYQKLFDYSGYQIAVMEIGLDLAGTDPVRVKVFYTPSGLHPILKPDPHLVGLFALAGGD